MLHKTKSLIDALKVVLGEVTVEGVKVIQRVKAATEIDVAFLRKISGTQVLSVENREWDGENAECGTQDINLDLWVKDPRQDAGSNQLEAEDALEAITDAIRAQAGHHSGGPFGAGTDLVRIEPVSKDSPDERLFTFRIRLTYSVLWG